MATRAPRPCIRPACRHLSRDGTGYCEEHKSQSSGWNRERRGSAHIRGYGAKWRKDREATLKRDKHLCQPCLKAGRLTPATEVDHIVNKAVGGTDEPSNLQSICSDCHKAKTSLESRPAGWGGENLKP